MIYEERQEKNVKNGIVILYVFLILPFLSVLGIQTMVGGLYSAWQAASMYILLMIILIKAKHVKIDAFVISLFVYEMLMILISTYYSGFNFGIAVVSMTFVLFTISAQFYRDEIIRALAFISKVVILINLVSVIEHIAGQKNVFFVGGKNQLSMFMIPAAALIVVNALEMRNRLNVFEIMVLVCVIFSIVIGASGAGIVCAFLAIVMFASNKLVQSKRLLFIMLLLANVFLLFGFREIIKTEYWVRLTEWLGKDASMTGRTTIWETSIDLFKERWLLGYGRGVKFIYLSMDDLWMSQHETHNMFLQVLYVTGVVGLVFFVRYLAKAISKLNMNDTIQRVLFIAIFICLVNGLVEANNDNTWFRLLLALAYYSGGHITKKTEHENALEEGDEVGVGAIEETAT